jgi:two-component system, chemotaxis family, CheB/CheR fusion protein
MKNSQNNLDEQVKEDNFIIAIGASAGGLEAISILFDNTPSDEVSYIIIQHLSPDYKSLMAPLLAKHSKLSIYVVENEMTVLPNSIYLLPEGKNMTISSGKLYLKERSSSTPNAAIDIFFNSLALDQGSKSIGIILSGNGGDGRKGIEAIKKVGGMVIVQEPDSTDNNSMPNNAISSGFYDFILTPAAIPKQITNYIRQKKIDKYFSDPYSEPNEELLLEILNLVKKHTPLNFSEYKQSTIVRRIIRRMVANNFDTIEEYIEYLKTHTSEVESLSKDFLISVTRFFRDPEAFEVIEKKVIPEIIDNKLMVDTLRVWVIGCATGEEAYSIAILI